MSPSAFSNLNSLSLYADGAGYSAIFTFSIYIVLVFVLAILSNRLRKSNSAGQLDTQGNGFLSEYFLGRRTLGVWAFALTFAATSSSGGSFMGFPSLVYTGGWSYGLWIAGYMLVPIVAMGLLAKRVNQFSRKTNAITIPELMRGRFNSPAVGILATYFIIFFMVFNLVAQFKAGSKILQTLLSGIPVFDSAAAAIGKLTFALNLSVDPAYVFCLLVFGLVVIAYTTYGGFRAVVWTDVLQGIFMVAGILFMLPVAIWAVGGLGNATQRMSQMKPPPEMLLQVENAFETIPKNSWLFGIVESPQNVDDEKIESPLDAAEDLRDQKRLFRVKETTEWNDKSSEKYAVTVIEVVDYKRDYTANQIKIYQEGNSDLRFRVVKLLSQDVSAGKFVSLPGYDSKKKAALLPIALAVSFFFFWTFSAAGQPSNMVRLMAFKDSATLKRAIFTVCIYYSLIYFPIVVIFCCAKVLLPGWETDSDRIMPEMARVLTKLVEMPWLAGLLVAAPFAAVMSTMDSFLLMISSSVVRDIYQRKNPYASAAKIKKVTYVTTIVVGIAAMLAAVNPPKFLQDLIIFTGGGLSTTFLAPIFLSLYWKRFNAAGAIAGLASGFLFHSLAYLIGYIESGQFSAYYLLGFDPFVPGTLVSLASCICVSLVTQPPDNKIVLQFFYRKRTDKQTI